MVNDLFLAIAAVLAGGIIAGGLFYVLGRRVERRVAEAAGRAAQQQAARFLEEGRREAEATKAAAVVAAKEEVIRARELWEKEAQRRRQDIERLERRVEERDAQLDRKQSAADRREQELPPIGFVELEDPETGEQVVVNTSDRAFRDGFIRHVQEARTDVERTFRKTKVDVIDVRTGQPYVEALMQFFQKRARRFR